MGIVDAAGPFVISGSLFTLSPSDPKPAAAASHQPALSRIISSPRDGMDGLSRLD